MPNQLANLHQSTQLTHQYMWNAHQQGVISTKSAYSASPHRLYWLKFHLGHCRQLYGTPQSRPPGLSGGEKAKPWAWPPLHLFMQPSPRAKPEKKVGGSWGTRGPERPSENISEGERETPLGGDLSRPNVVRRGPFRPEGPSRPSPHKLMSKIPENFRHRVFTRTGPGPGRRPDRGSGWAWAWALDWARSRLRSAFRPSASQPNNLPKWVRNCAKSQTKGGPLWFAILRNF